MQVIDIQEDEVQWGLAVKASELRSLVINTVNYIHACLNNGIDSKFIDDAMRDIVRSSEFVNDDSELIAKFFDHVAEKIEV